MTADLAGCVATDTVNVTVNTRPQVDDLADITVCENYVLPVITGATLTGNETYRTVTGGAGVTVASGSTISSTTTLFIYDESATAVNCTAEESVTINVNTTPIVNDLADIIACDNYTLPTISGNDLIDPAYYSATNGGGTRYNIGDVLSTTTPLFIYDETNTIPNCSSEETFNITINITPVVNDLANAEVCDMYKLPAIGGTNLTGNESYFTGPDGSGSAITGGTVLTTTTILYIFDETATTPNCSTQESVTITINVTPTIDDIPNETACDTYILPAISGTNLSGSQNYFTGSNGSGVSVNAGDIITNTNTLFLYDATGTANMCSSEEEVTFTVTPQIDPQVTIDL